MSSELESVGTHYARAQWRSEEGGYVGHATRRDEYGGATTAPCCGSKHRREADAMACVLARVEGAAEVPAHRPYNWRGTDRKGVGRSGSTTRPAAEMAGLVQRWFRAGWTFAEVWRDGTETGGIGRNKDTGERTWWAET